MITFIIVVLAAYFLTSMYFEAMNLYKPKFYEQWKTHIFYKYWTFCYQCTSFWIAIPLLVMSIFTISNFFVITLAVAGASYLIYNAFETLISYNMEG